MNAYRAATPGTADEIATWLRELSANTRQRRGVGKPVDQNTTIAQAGDDIADEIERKWGSTRRTAPTHPNGGYAYMGCRCRGCR